MCVRAVVGDIERLAAIISAVRPFASADSTSLSLAVNPVSATINRLFSSISLSEKRTHITSGARPTNTGVCAWEASTGIQAILRMGKQKWWSDSRHLLSPSLTPIQDLA